jgi:riboflavin kinase/FMN adenylyltransferase
VFITETKDLDDGRSWHSISNVGTRPTFDGHELTVETFLLSPFASPDPRQIAVEFRRLVRAERAFPDATALREQILRDVGRAQAYWRRVEAFCTGAGMDRTSSFRSRESNVHAK